MMAWVRTGTSLITFGFSVYKFFQMEMSKADINAPIIGSREFALVLIGIGLLSLLLGTIEHGRDLRAMRQQYPGMPRSMSAVVAVLIAALGVAALLAVIYRG
jgi:putative membrane protein